MSRMVGSGSLKQKARDNFAAIELSQRLDQEARPATEEEKRVLVRYVGWGGIPQVFASWQEPDASDWREERQTIERLLTPTQYEAARASTLNAHYTAPAVVSAMYEAVERLGFTGGRVLEPAVGLGHFFGLMPQELHARFEAHRHRTGPGDRQHRGQALPGRRRARPRLRAGRPGGWLLRSRGFQRALR